MTVTPNKSKAKNTNANRGGSTIDLQEEISRRAFELYERRGCEHGHEVEDWLQAEAELSHERTKPVAIAAVKKTRPTPVPNTGKQKTKQVKKARSASETKTKETRDGH